MHVEILYFPHPNMLVRKSLTIVQTAPDPVRICEVFLPYDNINDFSLMKHLIF